MKPKSSHRIPMFPPLMICLALGASQLVGAPIDPNADGDINVPANYNNGAPASDTIRASGSTAPTANLPYVVLIANGATLVGDPGWAGDTARISSPGYEFRNSGSLLASGTGLFAPGGNTVVINSATGIIQGTVDGIFFQTDGGSVTNAGLIRGTTGASANGIEAADGLVLENSGDISGASGVFAGNSANLTNDFGGTIAGSTFGGTDVLDGAVIHNFGSITSDDAAAISARNGAIIQNLASEAGAGQIMGEIFGIHAGDQLTLVNEAGGRINASSSSAVFAGNGASIFNDPGGMIDGNDGGITVGIDGFITNDGTIRSALSYAITGAGGLQIENSGLIEGTTGVLLKGSNNFITNHGLIRGLGLSNAIDVAPTAGGVTLTNTGEIHGVAAFEGGAGDDILNLNQGSHLVGSVIGGGGTDRIHFTGGLATPGGLSNVIAGDVLGLSAVTKSGSGVGFIGDVFAPVQVGVDQFNITGGGLYINGDITNQNGGQSQINAGGAAIGGTGIWQADIAITAGGISAGAIPINLTVNPEHSVGFVNVFGDVDHRPGSFIRFDVIPDAPIDNGFNSDLINVVGAGNVYNLSGGNFRISSTDVNRTIRNGTYTLIDADEPIIGFDALGTVGVQFNPNTADSGPFFASEYQDGVGGVRSNSLDTVFTQYFSALGLSADRSDLLLEVNRNYQGLPGLNANQRSLGAALDQYSGSQLQDFIGSLDFSNLSTVQMSIASLTPDQSLGLASGVMNQNYRLHRMIENHNAYVRSSAGEVGYLPVGTYGDFSAKGGMMPGPTMMDGTRWNIWGGLSYDHQDYDGDSMLSDYDSDVGSLTIGADYRVNPDLVFGGVFDGSTADTDYNGGGGADIDSYRIAVYGTYGRSIGLYSDFLLGYGSHEIENSSSFAGVVNSVADANGLQALATSGYSFGNPNLKHGPFGGFEYQYFDVDSYTQRGGLLPVGVSGYDVDSLRGLIGYRADGRQGRYTSYASVAYAYEFQDDGAQTTANIGGAGGVNFSLRGPGQSSAILLGIGAGYDINSSLALDLGYRGEFSTDDAGVDSNGVTLGMNCKF